MGKRGPQKTPKALNKLRGNPGRRQLPAVLNVPDGPVECPNFLNEEAKREWDRITPYLEAAKILKPSYSAALAVYCEAYAEFAQCVRALEVQGLVYESDKGNSIQHPLVGIKNKAAERMNRMFSHFGMSALTWPALQIPDTEEPTEKSKFFTA